jgi:hypothetical protein
MLRERKDNTRGVMNFGNLADHREGCYDVMEHDVLLEKREKPGGTRVFEAFSSVSNMTQTEWGTLEADYKYAGLAVTPYAFKLGAF